MRCGLGSTWACAACVREALVAVSYGVSALHDARTRERRRLELSASFSRGASAVDWTRVSAILKKTHG